MGCFMKLNRIVAKRTNKKNETHFFLKEIASGLLFVFLLPYVCAYMWGYAGEEKDRLADGKAKLQAQETTIYEADVILDWGVWKLPLEEYLVYKMTTVIPDSYEEEALMAQAVLLRTEFVRQAKEQNTKTLVLSEPAMAKWYGAAIGEELDGYREAVEKTEDRYLCYDGEPVLASYFKVSNGKTRNAGEVWNTDACPYLSGVLSEQDKSAVEFATTVTVERKNYLKKMRELVGEKYTDEELCSETIFSYDSAGYVTSVLGECDGERFRRFFGLNSASFTMQQEDDNMIFYVTGVGHGFGMSQYGANCKAVNGMNYQEILKDYFLGAELAKIE